MSVSDDSFSLSDSEDSRIAFESVSNRNRGNKSEIKKDEAKTDRKNSKRKVSAVSDNVSVSCPEKLVGIGQKISKLGSGKSASKDDIAKGHKIQVPPDFESNANSVDITRGAAVTTESAAKKLVLQYMKQQNRPYSVIQVHENLHNRIPKITVQRVLDSLSSESGGLKMKEYGKAKIYYLDQVSAIKEYFRVLNESITYDRAL